MRFITHILDILNITGIQRVVPPFETDIIALRCSTATAQTVYLAFTGSIVIYYTHNGVEYQDIRLASDWSGVDMSLPTADAETDIKIRGNITQAYFYRPGNTLNMLALNNTVGQFSMPDSVKTLDMRNAESVNAGNGYGVETLYAGAKESPQESICENVINNSPSGGVVWINETEAYASQLRAFAIAHGWTVNNL